jgi:hypothetical protein
MEKRENVAARKRKKIFFTSFSVRFPLPMGEDRGEGSEF